MGARRFDGSVDSDFGCDSRTPPLTKEVLAALGKAARELLTANRMWTACGGGCKEIASCPCTEKLEAGTE